MKNVLDPSAPASISSQNPGKPTRGITRRHGLLLTLMGSALALAGCGGGGGSALTAPTPVAPVTPVAASLANGVITGFGSIIVGGVRYDDSAASIQDDNNDRLTSAALKLGMVVRIKGGKSANDGVSVRAKADSIVVQSELLGPIDSIDTATGTLVVLGQAVKISATTVFEDGLVAADLTAGAVVEIYGFVDPANNVLSATRVERKPGAKAFKLQGAISSLNAASKTFTLGSLTIGYLSADLPASLVLANGLVVRVQMATAPLSGTRTALKIRKPEYEQEDINEVEIEGIVTAYTSNAVFSVNGLVVNTNSATKFELPVGVLPKVGDRIEVEGSTVNGVLMATDVKLENDEDLYKFELHGLVSSLDVKAKAFMLRGVQVGYSDATEFTDGLTHANFADGASVEVKGVLIEGGGLLATRISKE